MTRVSDPREDPFLGIVIFFGSLGLLAGIVIIASRGIGEPSPLMAIAVLAQGLAWAAWYTLRSGVSGKGRSAALWAPWVAATVVATLASAATLILSVGAIIELGPTLDMDIGGAVGSANTPRQARGLIFLWIAPLALLISGLAGVLIGTRLLRLLMVGPDGR